MTLAQGAQHRQLVQPFPDPIPGIIRFGSMNILAGSSGVGKTCLMAWILTRFRDGLPLFGHPVATPPRIGYICADRGWASANYWLSKVGYADIPFYSLADDPHFIPKSLRTKHRLTEILDACIEHLHLPPGSLVVVDPIALFLGGNLNDYQSCACACLEIRRLCSTRQITLWGLAHASKQKADKKERYQRLQDRIVGSTAQLAYGDTQMYLASPEEQGTKHYTFLWHSHTAPAQEFSLGRGTDGLFIEWADSVQVAEENSILQAIPVSEEGIGFGELIVLSGASKSTVHRYIQELIRTDAVQKVGHGRYRRASLH